MTHLRCSEYHRKPSNTCQCNLARPIYGMLLLVPPCKPGIVQNVYEEEIWKIYYCPINGL